MENRISVGSVTYAIKGRDALRRNGYKVSIERKPSESSGGCGYALRFSGDPVRAKEILRRAGIKIRESE